jgi:hypothetical protein
MVTIIVPALPSGIGELDGGCNCVLREAFLRIAASSGLETAESIQSSSSSVMSIGDDRAGRL